MPKDNLKKMILLYPHTFLKYEDKINKLNICTKKQKINKLNNKKVNEDDYFMNGIKLKLKRETRAMNILMKLIRKRIINRYEILQFKLNIFLRRINKHQLHQ